MFSNKEALERIEQAHGAKIEKMFWIAGSLESSDLRDLIEEVFPRNLQFKTFRRIQK